MKPLHIHHHRALLGACALAVLAGCAAAGKDSAPPGPGAQNTGLAPQAARITDERILSDRKTLDAVQQRLRLLNEAGVPQSNYSLAKAQCWLDTARSQYEENDRTGYVEESLAESMAIIARLESDRTARAGWDTPLVARSTRLRDDLWARLGELKRDELLACTAQTVACAEVRLVRAGHAEQQTGWRAAVPHVGMVEDALARARAQAQSCQAQAQEQAALRARQAPPPAPVAPRAAPTPAAVVAAAPPAATAPTVVTRETFVVLTDTLFAFNKSARADMLPAGVSRLQALVARLKNYRSIEQLRVVGHTDRLGSDEYNQRLSAQRAQTVREYLQSQGVSVANVQVQGLGEREATTQCPDKLPRPALIACLQPDRRVTIEVSGTTR